MADAAHSITDEKLEELKNQQDVNNDDDAE